MGMAKITIEQFLVDFDLRGYELNDGNVEMLPGVTETPQRYKVHGEFKRGEQATSALLPGFAVNVSQTLKPN